MSSLSERRQRQRKEALALANKTRIVKAELKRRLKARKIDPIRLIAGRDEIWSAVAYEMKVEVVLRAIPKIGPQTAHELIQEAGMYPNDRLAYRTQPEIDVLVKNLTAVLRR